MRQSVKGWIRSFIYHVPAAIRANQLPDTAERLAIIRASLEKHYFKGSRAPERVTPEGFALDMYNHLVGRITGDRARIIPWLNASIALKGARVLELGSGTGASTVALAEQGAKVTAIDIDADSLEVARDRCKAYGIESDLRLANAVEVLDASEPGSYDAIIFFACLEHMMHDERMHCLKRSWELLPKGGLLAIIETPNRMWYFDSHTSMLNGFHFLPDDLAFQYSKFSPRRGFNDIYREPSPSQLEHFLRRGRGASFHEFDLAIGPAERMQVQSLRQFQLPWSWLRKSSRDKLYTRFMRKLFPRLHSGWFDEYLDLLITKG